MAGDSISDFVCSFIVEQPKYIAVKDALERFCSTFLFDEQIKFHWEARVKEPDSLEKKLRRRSEDYATDVDNCRAIKDLVAGRIILPRWSTFQVVEEMIEEHFDLVSRTQHPKAPWKKKDTMQQRFRDYDGYHFYFTRKSSTVTDDLPDLVIEIQVMSPFMWAYQDLQHDLEYKALNGTPSEEESRALEYLRGIANLGEVAIKHFEDASWTRRGMPLTPARTLSLPTSSADHTDLETPLFRESLKSSARNVELLESLREFLEGKQSRLEAKSRQDVLAWISSTSAEVDHNRARDKLGEHYHDSGQWFKTYYNDWIASPDIGPLWVAGSVGTGKSSLISNVIEWHYKHTLANGGQLAMFYCSKGKGNSGTSPIEILRSFIAQLAESNAEVFKSVSEYYEMRNKKLDKQLTLKECQEILINSIEPQSKITFVVDALDECESDAVVLLQILSGVSNQLQEKKSQPSFLFSSRLQVTLSDSFPVYQKVQLERQKNLVTEDMEHYVRTQVENRKLWHMGRRLLNGEYPDLEERLINTLLEYANGMFRWVELQLEIFLGHNSRLRIRKDAIRKLERLEQNQGVSNIVKLREAYDELYDNNTAESSDSRIVVNRIIKWMMVAYRPLTIAELVRIVCISVEENGTANYVVDDISANEVRRVCSNFVIEDEVGISQFAHISVREYFNERNLEFTVDLCHTEIATTSLGYLCYPDSPMEEVLTMVTPYNVPKSDYAILASDGIPVYALLCWAFHWQDISFDRRRVGALRILYLRFLSKLLTPWIKTCLQIWTIYRQRYRVKSVLFVEAQSALSSSLFAACIWGFSEIIDKQYIDIRKLDELNVRGLRALDVAYACGNYDILLKLLEKGAKLVTLDREGYGTTPLMYKRERNLESTSIVDIIVSRMTPQDMSLRHPRDSHTALHTVAAQGKLSLTNILLDVIPPATIAFTNSNSGQTPLHYASAYGYKHIVQTILQKMFPADVNLQDLSGNTALQFASYHGHKEVVKLLLEKMDLPGITLKDSAGRTAADNAKLRGHWDTVRVLEDFIENCPKLPPFQTKESHILVPTDHYRGRTKRIMPPLRHQRVISLDHTEDSKEMSSAPRSSSWVGERVTKAKTWTKSHFSGARSHGT